jgi:hypothetical protein
VNSFPGLEDRGLHLLDGTADVAFLPVPLCALTLSYNFAMPPISVFFSEFIAKNSYFAVVPLQTTLVF